MNNGKTTLRTVKTAFGNIQYELTRKKVKNLNLRVTPEGAVKASVPYRTSCERADDFVRRNAEFVFKAIEKVKIRAENKLEHIFYLGEKINISQKDGKKASAELKNGLLVLTIPEIDSMSREKKEAVSEKTIQIWEKEEGKKIFPPILQKGYERFSISGLKVPYPRLNIRVMKSRWGSCTAAKGKICLNALLVEKPIICTEYVVCHELSHFLVQNHSEDFYRVLGAVFPNYKEVRKLLNNQ